MMFDNTFKTLIKMNLKSGVIPMLLGEVGIGKSCFVESLANEMDAEFFELSCNQLQDKKDVTGNALSTVKEGHGTMKFPVHNIITAAVCQANETPDKGVLLFLDEINRTTPEVTSELLSIPTRRKIGDLHVPKNLRIIIAANDRGHIAILDEASISRFVLYYVEPDLDTFIKVNPTLNKIVHDVLKADPSLLLCKEEKKKAVATAEEIYTVDRMKQVTTPRTISNLSIFLNGCSQKDFRFLNSEKSEMYPNISLLYEVMVGHTGDTRFTRAVYKSLLMSLNSKPIVQQKADENSKKLVAAS